MIVGSLEVRMRHRYKLDLTLTEVMQLLLVIKHQHAYRQLRKQYLKKIKDLTKGDMNAL